PSRPPPPPPAPPVPASASSRPPPSAPARPPPASSRRRTRLPARTPVRSRSGSTGKESALGYAPLRRPVGGRFPMAMSFYIKKSFTDPEPGIELVNVHYTWSPLGQPPNWDAHRETRSMPRGGVLLRARGGTTLDDSAD